MNHAEQQLLLCLKAYSHGDPAAEKIEHCSTGDWHALHQLAAVHSLLPVVHESLRNAPDFCLGDGELASRWKRETIVQAVAQSGRTQRLLALTSVLEYEGIRYAVVKGVVLRQMYHKPDLRPSGDEDLFIFPEDRERCGKALAELDFTPISSDPAQPVDHWYHPGTGLHIELHTSLFDTGWPAEEVLNPYFARQLPAALPTAADRWTVYTLPPTPHFIFLVSHALKHFIAGGFGVRTLCDILTFARVYGDEIRRDEVYRMLDAIHGREFFRQLLAIGQACLGFDPEGWELPDRPDFQDLLADILEAGVYGQTSMDRKHSAALALNSARSGEQTVSVLSALFPPPRQLAGRYPILRKAPILLPFLWVHRILCYALELLRGNKKTNSPFKTLALGKKRTEMMVRYGVLPQDKTEDR